MIELHNITKQFGSFSALENVNFSIPEGELVSLLGPSGSGKTTLLRIIAGLETMDSGEIRFATGITSTTPVQDRNIGFVFQHYALFRHMTVAENIGFGLKVRGAGKKEISIRVEELLELIQLKGLAKRYPSQLSGGQKQRVALARALAAKPKVLLLDEPFGALDANVRKDLRKWLRNLHKEIHVTSIMVTHDQEEAFEVSDRVVILHQGKLQQIGRPDEIFHNPANSFVIKFLGNVNIFHGRVEAGKGFLGNMELSPNNLGAEVNSDNAKFYVRPHEWVIHRTKDKDDAIEAVIHHINAAGFIVKIYLKGLNGEELQAELPYEEFKRLEISAEDTVYLVPRETRVFSEDYVI